MARIQNISIDFPLLRANLQIYKLLDDRKSEVGVLFHDLVHNFEKLNYFYFIHMLNKTLLYQAKR